MSSIVFVFVSITGCGHQDQVQPSVQQVQQPQVIYQQAQPQQDNTGSMLAAGAIGYMLGNSGNRTSQGTNVVNKTIVNKTVIQQVPVATIKNNQVHQTQTYSYKTGVPSRPSSSFRSSSSSFKARR